MNQFSGKSLSQKEYHNSALNKRDLGQGIYPSLYRDFAEKELTF